MKNIYSGKAVVEFYDASYDFDTDEDGVVLGQFIARYDALGIAADVNDYAGLGLDSKISEWMIDANSTTMVRKWLNDKIDFSINTNM